MIMTDAPNSTIEKFDFPDNVIRDYRYWTVMMRPKQITLGCLVIACKEQGERLPDLSMEAFAELQHVTGEVESTLETLFDYDKINYCALMMVDKHVHWHVIPRYASEREAVGVVFEDQNWPKPPVFGPGKTLSGAEFAAIRKKIRQEWVIQASAEEATQAVRAL
ncbi:MAG: HIT family protein [Gammaproteobacteria bacterium]|nr:HIT family protein [Gammaproteobacteria bacterium]